MITKFAECIDNSSVQGKIDLKKIEEGVKVAKRYDEYMELFADMYSSSHKTSPFVNLSKYEKELVMKILRGDNNFHTVKKLVSSDFFKNPEDRALHKILTDPKYINAIITVAEYFENHYAENPVVSWYLKRTYQNKKGGIKKLKEAVENDEVYDVCRDAFDFFVESLAYYCPPEIPDEYAEAFEEIKKAAITARLLSTHLNDDTISEFYKFAMDSVA